MLIFDYIYKFTNKSIEKIYSSLNIVQIFENRMGIKINNSILKNYHHEVIKEFYIKPEKLFLGFDALKDKYTLCGTLLCNSPHVTLMKELSNNSNIKYCEYIKRYINGFLDGRKKHIFTSAEEKIMKEKFNKRVVEINNDEYEPIQVYEINGTYYIADGKHRASLCYILNKEVKCVQISNDYLKDSIRMMIYRKMKKKQNLYQKNIELFEKII